MRKKLHWRIRDLGLPDVASLSPLYLPACLPDLDNGNT
jgi:hypothetical protein